MLISSTIGCIKIPLSNWDNPTIGKRKEISKNKENKDRLKK